MRRANPKLVLALSIILSLAIAYWGIAFNQATIIVESELDNFDVKISDKPTECKSTSCSYKVKPRSYTVSVKAKGLTGQEFDLRLDRGDKYTINYEPLKLPEIQEADKRLEEYSPAQLRTDSSGEQTLWIDFGEELGERQVTRFPNTLSSPIIESSPSLRSVLVKSRDQIWLVDTQKETKKLYEFALEQQPTRFRFLSEELVVVDSNGSYKLYDLKSGRSTTFPVDNYRHVITTEAGDAIVLSFKDLEGTRTNSDEVDLLNLITETGEDFINRQANETISMYVYVNDQNQYIFIEELRVPKYGANPVLKKSKDNIYLETNKGQFILNL